MTIFSSGWGSCEGWKLRPPKLTIAGRTIAVVYADNATATQDYNAIYQRVKSVDPNGVTSLYGYNAKGERSVSILELNSNGIKDLATAIPITQSSNLDERSKVLIVPMISS